MGRRVIRVSELLFRGAYLGPVVPSRGWVFLIQLGRRNLEFEVEFWRPYYALAFDRPSHPPLKRIGVALPGFLSLDLAYAEHRDVA